MRMPLWQFATRCRADYLRDTLYHVVDNIGNGLEHFAYAFADKAAADTYHAGLGGFVSSQAIDVNNSRVIRTGDPAYAAGLAAGATASIWDPVQHGPNVGQGQDSLNVLGGKEFARLALGRDPANGGLFYLEADIFPGGSPINIRPTMGWVDANSDCTQTGGAHGLGEGAHDWAWFMDNPAGINGSKRWHNGATVTGWDTQVAGNAKYVMGFLFDMATLTGKIFRDNVLKDTWVGIGANGTLLYPAFGSLSNAGTGGQSDFFVVRARGNFVHAQPGAAAWIS
jgi:hypothetical protein